MQAFTVAFSQSGQKALRREGPEDEVRPTATSPRTATGPMARPTYGVDLNEQMARDGVEVPRVLEKCAEAIEAHGAFFRSLSQS